MPEHVLMSDYEIITDGGRRRRWSANEKLRIVEETLEEGTSISVVARRNGVAPDLLYRWHRLMLDGGAVAVSVHSAEQFAGAENVLHLPINEGTDLALLNAIMTEIVDQGWTDDDFIAASTFHDGVAVPESATHPASLGSLEHAMQLVRLSLDEAATITGVPAADIARAAEWIARPHEDGSRRNTASAYEKGIIWGNDNYRVVGAMVNIALATGNIGREGGGVCRLGGHQEGYFRPDDSVAGRPAEYVDQFLIRGLGGVHHVWACDHHKVSNATRETAGITFKSKEVVL